jgi:hypothetical protein
VKLLWFLFPEFMARRQIRRAAIRRWGRKDWKRKLLEWASQPEARSG